VTHSNSARLIYIRIYIAHPHSSKLHVCQHIRLQVHYLTQLWCIVVKKDGSHLLHGNLVREDLIDSDTTSMYSNALVEFNYGTICGTSLTLVLLLGYCSPHSSFVLPQLEYCYPYYITDEDTKTSQPTPRHTTSPLAFAKPWVAGQP
jgi:hypothetical protein